MKAASALAAGVFVLLLASHAVVALPPWKDSIAQADCNDVEKLILREGWTTLKDLLDHRSDFPLDPADTTPVNSKFCEDTGCKVTMVTKFNKNGHATKTLDHVVSGKYLAEKYFGGSNPEDAVKCLNDISAPMQVLSDRDKFKLFCTVDGYWKYAKAYMSDASADVQAAVKKAYDEAGLEGTVEAAAGWTPHDERVAGYLQRDLKGDQTKLDAAKKAWYAVQRSASGVVVVVMKNLCPELNLTPKLEQKGALLAVTLVHELTHALCLTLDQSVLVKKGDPRSGKVVYGAVTELLRYRDADKTTKSAANIERWFLDAVLNPKVDVPRAGGAIALRAFYKSNAKPVNWNDIMCDAPAMEQKAKKKVKRDKGAHDKGKGEKAEGDKSVKDLQRKPTKALQPKPNPEPQLHTQPESPPQSQPQTQPQTQPQLQPQSPPQPKQQEQRPAKQTDHDDNEELPANDNNSNDSETDASDTAGADDDAAVADD